MLRFWVGEEKEDLAALVPPHVVEKLAARRANSPTRRARKVPKGEAGDACDGRDRAAALQFLQPRSKPGFVPLMDLPEDVAKQLFRLDGWFSARELLDLRVSRAMRALVGSRPFGLFRHALPALHAWRALSAVRRRGPLTPRDHRPRANSFQRSPGGRRRPTDRAVLLF